MKNKFWRMKRKKKIWGVKVRRKSVISENEIFLENLNPRITNSCLRHRAVRMKCTESPVAMNYVQCNYTSSFRRKQKERKHCPNCRDNLGH